MSGNLGRTGQRLRRREGCAMAEYDRLPPDLRAWLAGAALPWSPRSAARAFARALADHDGDRKAALGALAALQRRRLDGNGGVGACAAVTQVGSGAGLSPAPSRSPG